MSQLPHRGAVPRWGARIEIILELTLMVKYGSCAPLGCED